MELTELDDELGEPAEVPEELPDGVRDGVLDDVPADDVPAPLVVASVEVLPEVEAEATPGSSCATTPVTTTAEAAEMPATHRATRLGRSRLRSRRRVESFAEGNLDKGSRTMGSMVRVQPESEVKVPLGVPVSLCDQSPCQDYHEKWQHDRRMGGAETLSQSWSH